MLSQTTVRTCKRKYRKIKFVTLSIPANAINSALINSPIFLHACIPISELPSNISTI